ncbi:hypothetical protein BG004_004078 [Podila humilis]|nr:hypothetical protein BG004_004078 [Podila humilis]
MQNTMNAIGDYSDSDDDDAQSDKETTKTSTPSTEVKKKKKRTKKKKKSNKPELEDYENTDAALDEKEDPYDPTKSVAERVELAVTRFRKNRKFDAVRGQIFSVYLNYGGIKTGPKAFQGGGVASGGADDDNDGDPDYEAMNAGIDRVEEPDEGQVVDFENVATTFLSEYFLKHSGWLDERYYRDTPLVLAAFMSYMLVRNVLPEHEQGIKDALRVAEKAKDELPKIKMISQHLPGRFDKACSLLFGGEHFGLFDERPSWCRGDSGSGSGVWALQTTDWIGETHIADVFGMNKWYAESLVNGLGSTDGRSFTDITVQPRQFMELEVLQVELPEEDEKDLNVAADNTILVGELDEIEAKVEAMVDQRLMSLGATIDTSQKDNKKTAQTDAKMDADAQPEQSWPLPKLATVTFVERELSAPGNENQPPLESRRRIKVLFEKAAAESMLMGMRACGYVWTLSTGISYLEQAEFFPTFYLEEDTVAVEGWQSDDDF